MFLMRMVCGGRQGDTPSGGLFLGDSSYAVMQSHGSGPATTQNTSLSDESLSVPRTAFLVATLDKGEMWRHLCLVPRDQSDGHSCPSMVFWWLHCVYDDQGEKGQEDGEQA
jgi:hypothetical protein